VEIPTLNISAQTPLSLWNANIIGGK